LSDQRHASYSGEELLEFIFLRERFSSFLEDSILFLLLELDVSFCNLGKASFKAWTGGFNFFRHRFGDIILRGPIFWA
jgi:hypothetical protein